MNKQTPNPVSQLKTDIVSFFTQAGERDPIIDANLPTGEDQLLAALQFLTRYHGKAMSSSAILAGLPLNGGGLTPRLFERAALNANLDAEIVERDLSEVPQLVLPAVIFTTLGIRVLTRIDLELNAVQIIDPLKSDAPSINMTLDALKDIYRRYAIFLRPRPRERQYRSTLTDILDIHWFWSVVRRFKGNYAHIALSALSINVIALIFPLFTLTIYDRILPNAAVSSLVALTFGVFLSYVFDIFLRIARSKMIDMTGKQADVVLASNIFEHLMGLKLKTKPRSVGVLANQVRDFDSVREFFTSATLISISDILFSFIFIFVLFLVGGPLAIIPLILLPIMVLIALSIQKPLDQAMRFLQLESSQRHGILIESLSGLETVKAMGAEGKMQYSWEQSVAATARSGEQVHHWSSLALTLSNSAQQFAQLILIVWGVFLVMNNSISVGALVAANMLIGRILGPVTNVAQMLTRGAQTLVSLRSIDRIMNLPVERPKDRVYTSRPITQGSVDFTNVNFTYPESKMPAIVGLSFKIRPGERVGIVGKIGSGKTTVGRLLTALHDPDEGQIYIDGIDIRQYDPVDVRGGIGFVQQDVDMFFGTLRENITLGRPNATDEMVIEAARLAGVESFASVHPEGYDMMIAEGGRSLSGGQRQSIALARVLIRKPKIIFMDEPTSSLDMKSEHEFCQRLDQILGRDTTFIVSTHRVSLLRFVDRLMVFDGGKLVLDGPRDAVLKTLGGQESAGAR